MSEAVKVYDGAVNKGLEGVVASTTGISSIIDVTLSYRGYTIEDLAANSTFEEVCYLLWFGKLPTSTQLQTLKADFKKEMNLPAGLVTQLKTLPTNTHPMAWLRTAVSMLGMFDNEANDMSDEANRRKCVRLTAKLGLLITAFSRIRDGKDVITPNADKSIAWNFLYTLKGEQPDPEMVKIFDTCLVLHADHEFNCSAFAARVTASSLSDMYSAVVSAICALKGPLHGGANEQVMLMLKDIKTVDNVNPWLADALKNKRKSWALATAFTKTATPAQKSSAK